MTTYMYPPDYDTYVVLLFVCLFVLLYLRFVFLSNVGFFQTEILPIEPYQFADLLHFYRLLFSGFYENIHLADA